MRDEPPCRSVHQTNSRKLDAEGLTIIVGNSLTDPRVSNFSPYDLAFIDPPFAADLQLKALKRCVPMLASDGLIYVESPQEISNEILTSLSLPPHAVSKPVPAACFLAQKLRIRHDYCNLPWNV